MNFFLAISAFLICLFWAPVAQAHALSCTGPDGKIYYIDNQQKAKKCKNQIADKYMCHFNGYASCTWDGGYYPKETAQKDEPKEEEQKSDPVQAAAQPTSPSPTAQLENPAPQPVTEIVNTDPLETSDEISATIPGQGKGPPPGLEEAKKEAALAAQKVEKLKTTMAEIKMNNENNAILYRSPDADLFSVDNKFKAFQSKLSGNFGSSLANAGTDSSNKKKKEGARGLASLKGKKTSEADGVNLDTSAGASGRSSAEPANSATSDNPWVSYMGQTTKAALIDRLRKNPSLLDSLRDRIAELQSNGDQSGVIELMAEALSEAEKEGLPPLLDNLKPMSISEAFSMDSAETEAHIRSLLADLDSPSDPQFLPQASLFERVNIAHRRSVLRGSLKRQ